MLEFVSFKAIINNCTMHIFILIIIEELYYSKALAYINITYFRKSKIKKSVVVTS